MYLLGYSPASGIRTNFSFDLHAFKIFRDGFASDLVCRLMHGRLFREKANIYIKHYLSRVMRKPTIWFPNKSDTKPVCTITEDG